MSANGTAGEGEAMAHKRYDDFAVGVCLEVVGSLQYIAKNLVVVDFAIDSEGDGSIIANQWLSASVCEHVSQMAWSADRRYDDAPTPTIERRSWTRMVLLAIWLPLQSGPRWRTALPMRRAVGLNCATSGCLSQWWSAKGASNIEAMRCRIGLGSTRREWGTLTCDKQRFRTWLRLCLCNRTRQRGLSDRRAGGGAKQKSYSIYDTQWLMRQMPHELQRSRPAAAPCAAAARSRAPVNDLHVQR